METRTLISGGENREFDFNASAKTIFFRIDITQVRIMLVNNLTKNATNTTPSTITTNIPIYNFGCEGLGGTFANNTLTLEYDTTSMSNTDELLIVVEDNTQDEVLEYLNYYSI